MGVKVQDKGSDGDLPVNLWGGANPVVSVLSFAQNQPGGPAATTSFLIHTAAPAQDTVQIVADANVVKLSIGQTVNPGSITKRDIFSYNYADDVLTVGRATTFTGAVTLFGGTGGQTLGGNLLFSPDATYDIGASGATRPRDLYLGRNAAVGGNVSLLSNAGALSFGLLGDILLVRDAANVLAQRNGVTGQELRVYNTYTDAGNYERGFSKWTGNVFAIGTEAAGTGVGRAVHFYMNGAARWLIDTSGHFIAAIDNTYDIGAIGATRPRDFFLSRNAVVGGTLQVVGVSTHNASVLFSADNSFDIGASGATRPRDIHLGRNQLISAAAVGTSGTGVLGMGNGTEPGSSPADMVQLYSVDLSAGNATLGLRTETAVAVDVAVASTHSLTVRINGASYKIPLVAV